VIRVPEIVIRFSETLENFVMILDWKALLLAGRKRVGDLMALSPSTVNGYRTLHAAGTETKHLDAKTRELIALAVAVTTRCDSCIANHTDKASPLGTTREEIAEALGVAVAMNAGAALAYSFRVLDAHEALATTAAPKAVA
jgi:AhpD family alkylhydroperoxidase